MQFNVGNGSLWNGDCLELMRHIPDASVDMVLCDLPYGTTQNKWDSVIPFADLWQHYWRIAKPNAAIVLTASQPFTSMLVASQVRFFRHEWVWLKNFGSNFANTVREPFKEHETILVFGAKAWTFNKQMQERTGGGLTRAKYATPAKTGSTNTREFPADEKFDRPTRPQQRVPSSYQKFNCERGLHPTQKPIALFEYLIKTYTNPGDLVLDNCSGSGTTAIAAQTSGRRWLCIEKDPIYYLASCGRVHAAVNAASVAA